MSRRARTLADVVPLAAAEPDGLLITTDGAYVRLLACEEVLQPHAGGRAHREAVRRRVGTLAAHLPAGQAIQVIVDAEPLDTDRELARDWQDVRAAAGRATAVGDPELAAAFERLGYGLEQSIRRSADAVAAARLRWTVAACWTPAATSVRAGVRGRAVRTLERRAHDRAAADSARLAELVAADLAATGCRVRGLDGSQALAALARAIDPTVPARDRSALPRVLDTTDPADALAHRHALLASLTRDAGLRIGREWLERSHGGGEEVEVEAVVHVSSPPAETSPWWLLGLMELPPPWRLAVHVRATDRARQRRRMRLRHRRLWAELRRRERDGKLIAEDAYHAEREAAELAAELRQPGSGGLYELSIYQAIRRPASEADELAELLRTLGREFESYTDARLYAGRFLVEDSWISTLPLATDRLRAVRRVAQRNIPDCLPLYTTSASSRGGVPLGYALPGGTLERVDPFDPAYRTHVALVTGASGSGKTVTVNALLARNLARGATGFIIDRSSSPDETGAGRGAGHYEQLAALIPGARVIHYGAHRGHAVLCPWDVPDPAVVPASKVEFLVALHTMLIGDPTPAGPALGGLERTLLARGIHAVYQRCAATGEAPRERLLQDELRRLARDQVADERDGDATVATELRRLAERLHPYIGDGPSAWLADQPTTVTGDAPLVLFDLAGLADALAGPVILTLVEFIDRQIARRRAAHIAHRAGRAAGVWAGRTFVAIDEAWKPLLTPAAGGWLNEWARRTRHISCALLVITQHLGDLDNPQGRALLKNAVLRLIFHTSHAELAELHDTLGLHPEDLEAIAALETRKGEYASCFVDSESHGRATVRIYLSDIEYWACSADPDRDQPIRALALAEADGDAWAAMRRLVDADWHHQHADQLLATAKTEMVG